VLARHRESGPVAASISFAWLVIALVTPSTWALAVTHWKDVALAVFLLGATAFLSLRRRGLALASLGIAVCLRHNAIIAAVPLTVFWVVSLGSSLSLARRAAIFGALTIALAALPGLVDRVFSSEDAALYVQIQTLDVAGILVKHPEEHRSSILGGSFEHLRRIYNPYSVNPLVFGDDRILDSRDLADHKSQLRSEWVRLMTRYPADYLEDRWLIFQEMIAARSGPVFYPFHAQIDKNRLGFRLSEGRLFPTLTRFRDEMRDTVVFRGWFWLVMLCMTAGLALWREGWKSLSLWVALSGLAYAFAYVFIAVATDYRYLYWTEISVWASVATLIPVLFRRNEGASAPLARNT
jgi:hypothetical protein